MFSPLLSFSWQSIPVPFVVSIEFFSCSLYCAVFKIIIMSDVVNWDLHDNNLFTHISLLEILPKMHFEASWANIWLLPSQNKPKLLKRP